MSRIHAIFTDKNGKNLLKKEEIKLDYAEKNEYTHLYTLIVNPDHTYKASVGGRQPAAPCDTVSSVASHGFGTGAFRQQGESLRFHPRRVGLPAPIHRRSHRRQTQRLGRPEADARPGRNKARYATTPVACLSLPLPSPPPPALCQENHHG